MSNPQSPAQTDAQEAIDWGRKLADALDLLFDDYTDDGFLHFLRARGLAIVPIEPTTDMRIAGMNALLPKSMDFADECYRVMILARPEALK